MKSHSLFGHPHGPFYLLSDGDKCQPLDDEDSIPLPPPAVEIFPSDVVKSKAFVTEPIKLCGGFMLLKGRVNSTEILGMNNTDLVPGKYEGGLKLWECAVDLVNTLQEEIKNDRLSFEGKHVLELGCGHGLPGIYACLKGASSVHFQDYNCEVLRHLTIANVEANIEMDESQKNHLFGCEQSERKPKQSYPNVRYYAGDWEHMETLLAAVSPDSPLADGGVNGTVGVSLQEVDSLHDCKHGNGELNRDRSKFSGSQSCERGSDASGLEGGYDIILMSETVYSIASLPKLYALIKKCLRRQFGIVYLAGKKHYFGIGGGTRPFKSIVEEDGILEAHLVADFADGHSNVREIWKFF